MVTIQYSSGIVICYKNLPDTNYLQFHDSPSTLISVPEGYKFSKEPDIQTTITMEKTQTSSLSV